MCKKMFFIIAVPFVMAACSKSSNTNTTCTNVAVTAQAPAAEVESLRTFLAQHPELGANPIKDTSGMFYIILNAGTGTVTPEYCSTVLFTYEGRILNSSAAPFDQNSTGVSFYLRNLILGWQRGIPLIKKGGSIRLFIPPSLAYGAGGNASVPGNAYIWFNISLLDVTN